MPRPSRVESEANFLRHGDIESTFPFKALFKAEDEQDVRAASTAKAEQVAEMAEFNENVPLKVDVSVVCVQFLCLFHLVCFFRHCAHSSKSYE